MTRSNTEVFSQYDSELKLRVHSARNLALARSLLGQFQRYLGDRRPTAELAKGFLSNYAHLAIRTLAKYASTIKGFMKWYGEPIDDLKIKLPRQLPPYVEDSQVEKLLAAVSDKRSHKGFITRDRLLIELALTSGMRRGELASLVAGDIHADFLIVRKGKGGHDRRIPLLPDIARRLNKFIAGKNAEDSVFNLSGPTIGNKIRLLAKKAGLAKLTAHSLRHKFATDLVERRVSIFAVQQLMGHADIGSTQQYLSITEQGLSDAISTLDKPKERATTTGDILQAGVKVAIEPQGASAKFPRVPVLTFGFFEMDIMSDSIIIESLQIRTSDPSAPLKLMLFESNPTTEGFSWQEEDIIQMKPVTTRIYTFPATQPQPYRNAPAEKKLYGGVGIYPRHLPVALLDARRKSERLDYLKKEIDFEITLRYRL